MEEVLIKRIQFANVAGYLLVYKGKAVLVDTGLPGTTSRFQKRLVQLGLQAGDVSLIVLTHTHFDHAGGAREIQKFTGARLAVHTTEAPYLAAGSSPFPKGTRWKGKVIRTLGIIFARRLSRYPSVAPDLLIDHELDLRDFGIPGRVIHTPGHTKGSVSVFLENGAMIVGDNVLGIPGKEHFPPFADDREGVIRCWENYIALGANMLYPAHGIKVDCSALKEELEHAKKKYL
ncbi:MBL fold metallo-hydrolase [Bacteroidota bacterium]